MRKNKEFTENDVLPFLEVADLNSDTFKKARRLAGVWDDRHPWLMMEDAEILRSCGLWRKDSQTGKEGYTLAAALLFGKENTVLSCCPAYKTDAIYRNMTYERFLHPLPTDPDVRYDDRDDIRVNLIEAYQRLMTFVNRNLPDKFHIEGSGDDIYIYSTCCYATIYRIGLSRFAKSSKTKIQIDCKGDGHYKRKK